ncbi:MAG TPA: VCBS repeat-containing protein [Isosphaeraceae bacterium]|nr:VCBS repeat-containing protein [Isosphaeraceae bacterium]
MPRFRTALALLAGVALTTSLAQAGEPKWKQHTINAKSIFEAAGVFDVDNDGKLDIVSGDTWYQAPKWTPYHIRDVSRTGTYMNDFAVLPVDVNADGNIDFVTCAFFTKNVGWVENPGTAGKPWTYHEIDLPGASEAAVLVDLTGDGMPEVLPNSTNIVVWYELTAKGATPTWKRHDFGDLSTKAAGHGVGSGDVNGDGRVDLLTPKGWFESPMNPSAQEWAWHPEWTIGATGIQILARDVDGDGLSDIVYGMGHNYGLFWLQQSKSTDGQRVWSKPISIDSSVASVHTLLWADIDGDGKAEELLTGKRVYAHEVEPGDTDGSVVAWYSFDKPSKAWQKHTIFQGEPAKNAPPASEAAKRDAQKDFPAGTAGTGLQMAVIDIDGDGDLDLVCPGKSGLYLFENLGTAP